MPLNIETKPNQTKPNQLKAWKRHWENWFDLVWKLESNIEIGNWRVILRLEGI